MEYEKCINNNDNILMERINTTDVISIDATTVVLNDGTNITIPELQKCDLQETLRNVSLASQSVTCGHLFTNSPEQRVNPFTVIWRIFPC